MADRYIITGTQTAVETSPGETVLSLNSPGTTHRGDIYYFSISAGGTMNDQVQAVQVQRITALGTEGSGVVPAPVDAGAPASILDGAENHTAEPTFTAATELWEEDLHIRSTGQIQLQPDSWYKVPAALNAGIAIRTFSANYVGGARATFSFVE